MKYPFVYKIIGFNGDDKYYFSECGIGLCDSFAQAASIIEKRYQDELISIKFLELFEDSDIILMTEEMCEKWIDEQYQNKIYEKIILESEIKNEL